MFRIAFGLMPFLAASCFLVPLLPVRSEEMGGELERLLERKCSELSIEIIQTKINLGADSPRLRELSALLQSFQDALSESKDRVRQRIRNSLEQIEREIQAVKMGGKETDMARLQFLELARAALMKRDLEIAVGPLQFADDAQKAGEKLNKNVLTNSKLHLKLANGTELDAEGPFLQQSPEARELLEQFVDPAKDGALSFRIPDPMDGDAAAQLIEMIKKVAPKAEVTFNERLRLVAVTSDDPAQIRRVAGILKSLRPNFDPNNPKGRGDFNPGAPAMKGQFGDGGEARKLPPRVQPPILKGRQELEDMKRKKDTVDDKF